MDEKLAIFGGKFKWKKLTWSKALASATIMTMTLPKATVSKLTAWSTDFIEVGALRNEENNYKFLDYEFNDPELPENMRTPKL